MPHEVSLMAVLVMVFLMLMLAQIIMRAVHCKFDSEPNPRRSAETGPLRRLFQSIESIRAE
jgi:hypothetical protein